MTTLRLFAIALMFFVATAAWFALGVSVTARSGEFDEKLATEVAQLWGGPHRQVAPRMFVERERQVTESIERPDDSGRTARTEVTRTVTDRVALPLASTRVDASLGLEHRQKGLLWYDTYTVRFRGRYTVSNPDTVTRTLVARVAFPSRDALYDGLTVRFGGADVVPVTDPADGFDVSATVAPGAVATLEFSYQSRGLDTWRYGLAEKGVSQAQDLVVAVVTDFDEVDFPAGTISPTAQSPSGSGRRLEWVFDSLVTGQDVGVDLPERTNPGPLAARITFFAPVSLLFFLSVLVIVGVLQGASLHPMNYAFVAAAFFAFHLLLAYLVDHVQIHLAFGVSALTSIALVMSYLRIVAGTRFALLQAGVAQLVFLVFFSYAFFFEGFTGLTVTIGAVLTLFTMMQLTARVDWSKTLMLEVPKLLGRTSP